MATTGPHPGKMAREDGPKSRGHPVLRQMGLQAVHLDRVVLSLLYVLSLLKAQLSFRMLYLSLDTTG
jgi:hypothetical protein